MLCRCSATPLTIVRAIDQLGGACFVQRWLYYATHAWVSIPLNLHTQAMAVLDKCSNAAFMHDGLH